MRPESSGRIILVVSADMQERRRLQFILSNAGFGVREAETGVQCLTNVLEQDPDLILLARDMPPLQAIDFLRILKRLTLAPIIVIGEGNGPFEVAVLEAGADFYQQHPLGPQMLVARTRALMRRYSRASLDSPTETFAPNAAGRTSVRSGAAPDYRERDKRMLPFLSTRRHHFWTLPIEGAVGA